VKGIGLLRTYWLDEGSCDTKTLFSLHVPEERRIGMGEQNYNARETDFRETDSVDSIEEDYVTRTDLRTDNNDTEDDTRSSEKVISVLSISEDMTVHMNGSTTSSGRPNGERVDES